MFRPLRWVCAAALALACSSDPTVFTLTSDKDNAKASGTEAINITAKVMKGEKALDRGTVSFTLDTDGAAFKQIDDPTRPPTADQAKVSVNVAAGIATTRLYSVTKGTVTVTAIFKDDVAKTSDMKTISLNFTGSAIPVSSFEYMGATPEQVPLEGSSKIKFKALNSQGNPVANLPVTFSVAPTGTATVDAAGKTLADGTVTTTLTAGKIAGTVTVTITAGEGADAVSKTSEAIAISGGGINAKNLTLVCPHYSIGGHQMVGLEMECAAYASDYSGAYVPNSRVILLTEAGGVPASMPLSADAAKGGVAKFNYRTQCQDPRDVAPLGDLAGDPGVPCQFWNQCKAIPGLEARTCNPRDGWASLVAISTGGEAFQDYDGNLNWDAGEPFTDLSEPFVDANDNGTRDSDEDFYDANNNGKWDDKNGVWDAYTAVWTSVKITWTGKPYELILEPGNNPGTGTGGANAHCTSIHYTGVLKDINGNPPTAAKSTDAVTATCTSTSNCTVTKIGGYSDNSGLVDVTIADKHSCTSACVAPNCVPGPFSVDFGITRTLDAKGSADTDDDLNAVIGTDPAPRTGTFE